MKHKLVGSRAGPALSEGMLAQAAPAICCRLISSLLLVVQRDSVVRWRCLSLHYIHITMLCCVCQGFSMPRHWILPAPRGSGGLTGDAPCQCCLLSQASLSIACPQMQLVHVCRRAAACRNHHGRSRAARTITSSHASRSRGWAGHRGYGRGPVKSCHSIVRGQAWDAL